MNPETKVTTEQLKAVCAKHGIDYRYHSRITTGFSHELHRINDDLVIKIYNAKGSRSFKAEAALLAADLPFPKPRLVASTERGDVIDRDYVIMTYVPGVSLGSKWHEASDSQREKLIKDICHTLKIINQINPKDIGLEAKTSWDVSLVRGGKSLVADLLKKNIIDASTADKILKTIESNQKYLKGSKLYPVYWDVHFDNFIVNQNFDIQAVIDLENVELTSLDYPLFVIQKMMDEPKKYLAEPDEKYADKKDYLKLKEPYRKYYPEMFAFDNLDARVKIYQLLDTLHLLNSGWAHVKELHQKLDGYIS